MKDLRFVTTNYILDETYTLYRSHLGRKQALFLRDKIAQSPKTFEIIWVYPEDVKEAWMFFAKLEGKGISFTDCVSFSVMKRFFLKKAFTFDKDFKKAGFKMLPRA